MGQIVAAVVLSFAAFVATSLDNLLLLVGFFTTNAIPRRAVVVGYVVAVGLVCLVALGLASAAQGADSFSMSWLGVAPLALGAWGIARALAPAPADGGKGPLDAVVPGDDDSTRRILGGAIPVFATMLANSGDSLLVFTALLGDTRSALDWVIIATILGAAVLWTVSAGWLASHPRMQGPLRTFSRYGLPLVLVALGIYILLDTPTDVVSAG